MNKGIILLSGVHGVGKGHFIENELKPNTKYKIVAASKLIQKYKEAADAGYKKVVDVALNQALLIEALSEELEQGEEDVILDGHLCIVNKKNEIEEIPTFFFEKLPIKGIILLQEKEHVVLRRQKERDGVGLTLEQITGIQNKEKEYCVLLKNRYRIPYFVIDNKCTYIQVNEMINEM